MKNFLPEVPDLVASPEARPGLEGGLGTRSPEKCPGPKRKSKAPEKFDLNRFSAHLNPEINRVPASALQGTAAKEPFFEFYSPINRGGAPSAPAVNIINFGKNSQFFALYLNTTVFVKNYPIVVGYS